MLVPADAGGPPILTAAGTELHPDREQGAGAAEEVPAVDGVAVAGVDAVAAGAAASCCDAAYIMRS